jgi:hypothetical protein
MSRLILSYRATGLLTIISFNLSLLGTAAKYAVGVPGSSGGASTVTAGNKAQFKATTACGAAATATVDLFGYTTF